MASEVLKKWRLGNVEVELRRNANRRGINDKYHIKRLIVNSVSGEIQFTYTFKREDIRDLISILTLLTAQSVSEVDMREITPIGE